MYVYHLQKRWALISRPAKGTVMPDGRHTGWKPSLGLRSNRSFSKLPFQPERKFLANTREPSGYLPAMTSV